MTGVLTAVLARSVRHSLGITGVALVVAGAVAFLPLGPTGFAESEQTEARLAAATSVEALRSVLTSRAEAAGVADATGQPAPAPTASEVNAAPAPAPEPTPDAIEAFGQVLVSSALQQATPEPVATPARAAVPVPRATPLPSIRAALEQSPWPAETWPTVERIIMCESSGNPSALSPAGYVGLMQVAPWLHGAVPADPVAQLAQAYEVYLRQGWGAWGCYYH